MRPLVQAPLIVGAQRLTASKVEELTDGRSELVFKLVLNALRH